MNLETLAKRLQDYTLQRKGEWITKSASFELAKEVQRLILQGKIDSLRSAVQAYEQNEIMDEIERLEQQLSELK